MSVRNGHVFMDMDFCIKSLAEVWAGKFGGFGTCPFDTDMLDSVSVGVRSDFGGGGSLKHLAPRSAQFSLLSV